MTTLVRSGLAAALALVLIGAGPAAAQTDARRSAGAFSIDAEALVWWFKGSPTPVPLVTDGVLGQPGTRVLLGGRGLDSNPEPGFRLAAGYTLTERWGVEGGFLYIPTRSATRSVSSSGQPGSTNLFFPFFNVIPDAENVTPISLAPSFRGEAREELSQSLLGVELNGTVALAPAGPWRIKLLGGFRYLRLKEDYTFTTSSPFNPPLPADVYRTTDQVGTTNAFYGPQLAVRADVDSGRWFARGTIKLGMGAMVQSADLSGSLVTNDFNGFGAPQTYAGGYFALPSNIGSHNRTVFAVVPELGLNAGFRITPWAAVVVGYTFLYTNNVARPGQQINRSINPTQGLVYGGAPPARLQGPGQPSFKFTSTDFWAQGVSVGVVVRF